MEFPRQFESARLILRSYQPGDGKWFYAMSLRNREHLRRYEADNMAADIPSEQAAEELVCQLAQAWSQGRYYFLRALDKQSGEFVAQVYIGPLDMKLPEFEVGYFVDVEHEGRGYVTEAVMAALEVLFRQMDAHRVSLRCDETNIRSIRVAERCGMIQEGRLRENRRNPDGSFSTSLVYAMLKSEFERVSSTDQALTFAHEMPQNGAGEIAKFLTDHWGSNKIVTRGKVTDGTQIPRITARDSNGVLLGLLTYLIDWDQRTCELVSINSERQGWGIGRRLMWMLEAMAAECGCRRIWLITTNDNPEAAAFYVKRGYRLVKVHSDALNRSRALKPQIPEIGKHGIPLRDEWEFEKLL